jgi:hypothetical protein
MYNDFLGSPPGGGGPKGGSLMDFGGDGRVRRLVVRMGYAALLSAGVASAAQAQLAQVGTMGGTGVPAAAAPAPVNSGRPDVFAGATGAENALIAGDWLIYPTAFGGLLYDSNVNQTTTKAQSSAGLRLVPSLLANTNNGLSQTTIYGMVDGRIYFSPISGGGDDASVRSGVIEVYKPLEDLTFTGQGDYTRQKDLFNTLGTTPVSPSLNPTGLGLSPTTNPQSYDQFSGSASVQKDFGQAFVVLGGSIVDQMYDHTTGATAPSPDGITYTGTVRGGYWFVPALYGFVEGSLDSRDLSIIGMSSSGYRTVAGLGTDQIGLVRGEVYGGYQSESYRSAGIGTTSNPSFGARGYYYPLPELTLNLAVDETLGATLLAATPTSPSGTSTKVTSVLGTAGYAIAPEWTATGRAGYIHTDYTRNVRRDDAWTLGTTLTYSIWRNVGVTLDYQHVDLSSNVALQSFTRDVVTLGVSYKY